MIRKKPRQVEAPTREHFEKLWYSPEWTLKSIAIRFRATEDIVRAWAKRWSLGDRPKMTYIPSQDTLRRNRLRKAFHRNNRCPENSEPGPDDPTPDDLLELTSYALARRIMEGFEVGPFEREYAS